MNETSDPKKLTFRRYKSGASPWSWDDLTTKIFQADHTHKCPTYVHRTPPVPGILSFRPRHPRLARHRARHGQVAGRRRAVAEICFRAHGCGQSVSVRDGPGLPGALRGRLQS